MEESQYPGTKIEWGAEEIISKLGQRNAISQKDKRPTFQRQTDLLPQYVSWEYKQSQNKFGRSRKKKLICFTMFNVLIDL